MGTAVGKGQCYGRVFASELRCGDEDTRTVYCVAGGSWEEDERTHQERIP